MTTTEGANRSSLSIIVTDSGLGGLSVMAELEKNLRKHPVAESVSLTFFNALADKNRGYNTMNMMEDKAHVFNNALEGMVWWYKPDIILIACNTLSVVYPETPFAANSPAKVLGIIDFGVQLTLQYMSQYPNSVAILLGTPTTIQSGAHKKRLTEKGIDASKIVEQPCHLLESAIQINPFSDTTRNMVKKFLAESKEKITTDYENIFPVFCCTHYGYSQRVFEEELAKIFNCPSKIINPNGSMSSYLSRALKPISGSSSITANIASRVPITVDEIKTLSKIINKVSPKVFGALTKFKIKPDLFNLTR